MKKRILIVLGSLLFSGVLIGGNTGGIEGVQNDHSSVDIYSYWDYGPDPLTAPKLKVAEFRSGGEPLTVISTKENLVAWSEGSDPMTVPSKNDNSVDTYSYWDDGPDPLTAPKVFA